VRPILFTLPLGGGLPLPSYGFFVALGFAVGLGLTLRRARQGGLDGPKVMDVAFGVLLAGLAGARLAYAAVEGDFVKRCVGGGAPRAVGALLHDCTAILRIWDGGLVFQGAAIATLATAAWLGRRKGLPLARLGDVFAPSFALGHALGRLGCFGAGCCFGKACAWAEAVCVAFPEGSVAHAALVRDGLVPVTALLTPPLHPTQLYEALGELLFCIGLLRLGRRRLAPGQLGLAWVGGYALLRFLVEIWRGDVQRGFAVRVHLPVLAEGLGLPADQPLFLSAAQAVCIVFGIAAIVGWCWAGRKGRKERSAP
jgi:phosphatidylglycerol:prolipoprotein diacylglycerol transferase